MTGKKKIMKESNVWDNSKEAMEIYSKNPSLGELPKLPVPITLTQSSKDDEDLFVVEVDSVEWVRTTNFVHALVLYQMMKENLSMYMNFKATEKD